MGGVRILPRILHHVEYGRGGEEERIRWELFTMHVAGCEDADLRISALHSLLTPLSLRVAFLSLLSGATGRQSRRQMHRIKRI